MNPVDHRKEGLAILSQEKILQSLILRAIDYFRFSFQLDVLLWLQILCLIQNIEYWIVSMNDGAKLTWFVSNSENALYLTVKRMWQSLLLAMYYAYHSSKNYSESCSHNMGEWTSPNGSNQTSFCESVDRNGVIFWTTLNVLYYIEVVAESEKSKYNSLYLCHIVHSFAIEVNHYVLEKHIMGV